VTPLPRQVRLSVSALSRFLVGSIIIDSIVRQLTRTTAFRWLPEDPGWRIVLALVTGLAGYLVARGGASAAAPRRGPRAMVFATALAVGLVLQLQTGARLQSDAFYYYSYLRSMTFDRDVSFANDYRMLGLGDKAHLFNPPTPTGYAHSAWTIGPAIVWSPFFATGHIAATRLKASGRDVATDGTSYPYRQSIVIAGLCYALLAWWFTLRFVEQWYARRTASIAVALMAGGTFMLWYTVVEPTMTHAPSMAAVAGFLWCWAASRDKRGVSAPRNSSVRWWMLLGALAGLMTLIRWQNALFAIVPACEAIAGLWRTTRSGQHEARATLLAGGLAFTVVAAIACLPQMIAWKAIYGSYLAVSPVGPDIRWTAPQLELVLFSSRNGLVAMSPLLYVAAIGLIAFIRRDRVAGVAFLAASAVMVYFNASIQDWWGSAGFGGRRFDGVVPMLALGLAGAWEWFRRIAMRHPQAIVSLGLAAVVVWNLTLMSAESRGVVRPADAVSFGAVGADQARTLHEWIGHPFSAPANWWFAWRNDISPAAYDRLAPGHFLGDPLQPYGRVDVGSDDGAHVGEGWASAERDGDTTYRWALGDAELLVPLAHAADIEVQVRLRAFTYPGSPPQLMTLDTGRATFGPVEIGADWHVVNITTPASAWRAGVNRVRLRMSRATRPVDVGAGRDSRPLAAAVDYLRVRQR
jgi:hypothetical protein